MNESEETVEIKTFSLYPYLLQGQQALPNCKPISVGRPGDVRYTTRLPHQPPPFQREAHLNIDYMYVWATEIFKKCVCDHGLNHSGWKRK